MNYIQEKNLRDAAGISSQTSNKLPPSNLDSKKSDNDASVFSFNDNRNGQTYSNLTFGQERKKKNG